MAVKALGFDIDGTLYPNWMMILAGVPTIIIRPSLFLAFGRARRALRKNPETSSDLPFRERQAYVISEFINKDPKKIKAHLERDFYSLWEKSFRIIKPFHGMKEALLELTEQGYPLGALSDFPVGDKLSILGVEKLFSCAVSAEDAGYLKPHREPFMLLSEALGFPPEEILYIGNSYSKDILGAKAAGMKTALITNRPEIRPETDIQFRHYRELSSRISSLA